MVAGPIKLKSIVSVVANTVTAENVLSFADELVMNITPQFVPNYFPGVDVLEKAKFRRLTIVFDSDNTPFDLDYFVNQTNIAVATAIVATFAEADGLGTTETWTYEAGKSWVEKKEIGRIEDGARRNTFEYSIICFGSRLIATV